jgi:hypothetical protein
MSMAAEKVRAINAVLAQWQGEQAQFWSYTAALASLEVRLFSARHPGNVHLVCSPCLSIAGPVYWEQCELRVTAGGADDLFLVQDQAAGVRILCRQVHLFENVEPLFTPPSAQENGGPAALLSGEKR